MKIQRDYYLNQLIAKKHNGLIKTISGLRRSGKSYLLFELFYQHLIDSNINPDHIIKVQLDELTMQPYLNNLKLFEFIKSKIIDEKQYYVLIDEIQNIDSFESMVIELSRIKNVDVYITGSNSKLRTYELDTILRGKDDPIHVYPLSFCEFMQTRNDKQSSFVDYCKFGGLPYITYLKTDQEKRDYLNRLFNETYIRDILENKKIKNKSELSEIMDVVSTSLGSLINSTNISNTFLSVKNKKIKYSTIDKYLSYFEESFILNKVNRYDLIGRKSIGAVKKYYFEDVGLRNARTGFKINDIGHIIENIIFNELKLRGFQVNVGMINFRILNKDTNKSEFVSKEIDFVAWNGVKKYCIQVCNSLQSNDLTKNREIDSLRKIPNSYTKIIITNDNIPTSYDENGILYINIINFLLDSNILK